MINKIYVTTSIPYVNARPHLGFALELVQADAIARYHRLIGNTVRLQTGTDENAFKNVLAARDKGVPTQAFVDANADLFRALVAALGISADDFLRTTECRHRQAVQCFWERLRPEDLYCRQYTGLYCTACEDFYLERDLVDGRCPDHGTELLPVAEENWFFRLSAYQSRLQQLLEADTIRVVPDSRKQEVLSFVRRGLQDISVSRLAARSGGWGIPVPGAPAQVIYVWIDALINYLSGPGYGTREDWQKFWGEDTRKIHIIGKNVWKFHAVYWPALLLATGLPLPDEIVVHGFLIENGAKISKSRGSAIDPFECVTALGADAVRYFLLRTVSPFADSDVTVARLEAVYHADLANGLGNLVSRLAILAERAGLGSCGDGAVPEPPDGYHQAVRAYRFDTALERLWEVIAAVNRDIERARPWEALRTGSGGELSSHIGGWLRSLHTVAYWLAPFLPETSDRILRLLSGRVLQACAPLFPRRKLAIR